jgi:serine protease Do
MKTLSLRWLALFLGFGLLVAACGGGDDSAGEDDGGDETTTTTEAEEEEEDEPDDTTTTTEVEEEDEGDRDDAIGDFGESVEDELGDVPEATEETGYTEYTTVTDDSGILSVEVPVEWTDVNGAEGTFGPDIIASTNVQEWIQTYNVSGLEFQATPIETNQSMDEVLTAVSQGQAGQCTSLGRQPYSDPAYTGVSEVFQDCAGSETDFAWVAFEPSDGSFHGVIGVQILSDADVEALERALASFLVTPP